MQINVTITIYHIVSRSYSRIGQSYVKVPHTRSTHSCTHTRSHAQKRQTDKHKYRVVCLYICAYDCAKPQITTTFLLKIFFDLLNN